jgi:hypothetical protein
MIPFDLYEKYYSATGPALTAVFAALRKTRLPGMKQLKSHTRSLILSVGAEDGFAGMAITVGPIGQGG